MPSKTCLLSVKHYANVSWNIEVYRGVFPTKNADFGGA